MSFNIEIGQRIKNARLSAGLSLKELGEKIELSEGNVQRYEAGKIKSVDVNIIKKIAKALNCTEFYLMGWDEWQTFSKARQYFLLYMGYKLGFPTVEYVDGRIENLVRLTDSNDNEVYFSEEEFDNLMQHIKELIEFFFWKQSKNGHELNSEM